AAPAVAVTIAAMSIAVPATTIAASTGSASTVSASTVPAAAVPAPTVSCTVPAGPVPALAAVARAAAAPGLAVVLAPVVVARRGVVVVDRLHGDEHATAVAVLTRGRERLQQARADPLPGHLNQAQRGDLGHLVLGPVPGQALQQPP